MPSHIPYQQSNNLISYFMNNFKSLFCFNTMLLVLLLSLASCERDEPKYKYPVSDNENTYIRTLTKDDSYFLVIKDQPCYPDDYPFEIGIYNGHFAGYGKFNGSLYRVVCLGDIPLEDVKTTPADGWQSADDEILFEKGQTFILEFYAAINPTYSYLKVRVIGLETGKKWIAKGPNNKKYSKVVLEVEANFDPYPETDQDEKISLPAKGGVQDISFKSPASFIEPCSSYPEWLKILVGRDKLQISYETNLLPEPRSYSLKLSPDQTIDIFQEGCTFPKFDGGDGSATNPYRISTPAQLDSVRYVPDAHFIQTKDLDLKEFIKKSGGSWYPISDFSGSYDGQGHWIKNLTISVSILWPDKVDSYSQYIALFINVKGAEFQNIRLHVGEEGIVGTPCFYSRSSSLCICDKKTIISRCSVEGSFINGFYTYGLASDATLSECYSNIPVIGISEAYGLSGGIVKDSYVLNNIAPVSLESEHNLYALGEIAENCYTTGEYRYISERGIEFGAMAEKSFTSCYSLYTNTVAELKQRSTYVGWDFDNVWTIDEGVSYPKLRCFEKM